MKCYGLSVGSVVVVTDKLRYFAEIVIGQVCIAELSHTILYDGSDRSVYEPDIML